MASPPQVPAEADWPQSPPSQELRIGVEQAMSISMSQTLRSAQTFRGEELRIGEGAARSILSGEGPLLDNKCMQMLAGTDKLFRGDRSNVVSAPTSSRRRSASTAAADLDSDSEDDGPASRRDNPAKRRKFLGRMRSSSRADLSGSPHSGRAELSRSPSGVILVKDSPSTYDTHDGGKLSPQDFIKEVKRFSSFVQTELGKVADYLGLFEPSRPDI